MHHWFFDLDDLVRINRGWLESISANFWWSGNFVDFYPSTVESVVLKLSALLMFGVFGGPA